MNKLNPLYILALLITFFIITIFMLNEKKVKHKLALVEQKEVIVISKDFKEYKNSWFNKEKTRTIVNKIIKNSIFANEKILNIETKNSIKLKIESSNQKVLSDFLNRVLNEKLIIKKLQVERKFIQIEIGI